LWCGYLSRMAGSSFRAFVSVCQIVEGLVTDGMFGLVARLVAVGDGGQFCELLSGEMVCV